MIKSNIGNNIRDFRKAAQFTQAELAKAIDVSRPTISSWEMNRTEPSMQDVERLASVLNCKKSDLLGDYRDQLIKDANIQRMISLAEGLTRDQIISIVHQMEYLRWTNRKKDDTSSTTA